MLPYTANDMLKAIERDHGIATRDVQTENAVRRATRRTRQGFRSIFGGTLLSMRTLLIGG